MVRNLIRKLRQRIIRTFNLTPKRITACYICGKKSKNNIFSLDSGEFYCSLRCMQIKSSVKK